MSRRDEVEAGLNRVRARMVAACAAAARADDVGLVVVTKNFPASDVHLLHELGVTDVGENRHQEAEQKAAELEALGLRWHFIGGLQSNKAAAVASYAEVVESLDRPKLIGPLARGARERGRPLEVLIQVSLDADDAEGRAGVRPGSLLDLAAQVAASDMLRLRGLMAVAPLGTDPTEPFEQLVALRARLLGEHPDATVLSAGMSGDLEQAIAAGATHVRVGSAVLGSRPSVE